MDSIFHNKCRNFFKKDTHIAEKNTEILFEKGTHLAEKVLKIYQNNLCTA